jgi:hypothetical protein
MSLALDIMLPRTHTASFFSSSNFHIQLYTRAMLSLQVTLQWSASTVDRSDPTMTNEFKYFSRLPFEIRQQIWLYTVDLFPQILPFRPSLPLFLLACGRLDTGRWKDWKVQPANIPSNSTRQLPISSRGSGQSLPSFPPNGNGTGGSKSCD